MTVLYLEVEEVEVEVVKEVVEVEVEGEEEDTDNNRLSFHQLTTHGHHQIKWEMVAMDILVSSNTACLPNLHPCFIRTWD